MIAIAKHKIPHNYLKQLNKLIFNDNSKISQKELDNWFVYVDSHLVGFLQAQEESCFVKIHKFGVLPQIRRMGLMTLVFNIVLASYKDKMLACLIADNNLPCHLFLKKNGFSCVKSPDKDKYMFQKKAKSKVKELECDPV